MAISRAGTPEPPHFARRIESVMFSDVSQLISRLPMQCQRLTERVGTKLRAHWGELRHGAAVIGTVLWVIPRPQYWPPTARKAFVLQVLSMGIEPLWFVGGLGVFVGVSVVLQLTFWIGEAGQSQLVGPLLVTVVARELGPL